MNVEIHGKLLNIHIQDTLSNKTGKNSTVGTIPKWNIKIVERDKSDTLSHKYKTSHFPVIVQVL